MNGGGPRRLIVRDVLLGLGGGIVFAVVQVGWFLMVGMALFLLGGMDGYQVVSPATAVILMFAPSLAALTYVAVRIVRGRGTKA